MKQETNFLLGYGERLTKTIDPPDGGGPKIPPYTFQEAKKRLVPQFVEAAKKLDGLSVLACPRDQAVAVVTMHPQYIAKSYFPKVLLKELGLKSVGSRPTKITPEKWTRRGEPKSSSTTDLFVSGPRSVLRSLPNSVNVWSPAIKGAEQQLVSIEAFRPFLDKEKVKTRRFSNDEPVVEVVLHASPASRFVIEGFEAFVEALDLKADFDRRFYVGELCFIPMRIPREKIRDAAEFSFMRLIREMPKLRTMKPEAPKVNVPSFQLSLPNEDCVTSTPRVAIFDGGLSPNSPLKRWVTPIDPPGVGKPVQEYLAHGHDVTSAALFGPLSKDKTPSKPYSAIHHYRVLDDKSHEDPFELYSVLRRIQTVLGSQKYDFINLSIGPELPVDDDDVHGWTAYLDSHLSDGKTLAFIAAGNGGRMDAASGNARVQVPGDSVNALTVGACDSQSANWRRAAYSSYGPGRSPGIVKPDLLVFGGSESEPFWVAPETGTLARRTQGTSFASPALMHAATGLSEHLDINLSAAALKALLVHCADDDSDNRNEHGWGRFPIDINNVILCPESAVRILYQGVLSPAEYIRAQIPTPLEKISGNLSVRATFCYTTEIDPQDPGNYTRSGLEVRFRPHDEKFAKGAKEPKTAAFFQLRNFSEEDELRKDAHKWETTLHREVSKNGASLKNPVFDIHYNAREGGGSSQLGQRINYALVVTVSSPKMPDIYNRVVRRYATILQPLRSKLGISIRT